MSVFARFLRRMFIACVALASAWLIVVQVFDRLDQRLPLLIALILTYVISAYCLMPVIIHITTTVLRKGRIPRYTHAKDGLTGDPVNFILFGTKEELLDAFAAAQWRMADTLTPWSAWKMTVAFVTNRPYPAAPFRSLYLFGRRQDYGFQEPIDGSPRKRHHIRFWAVDANPETEADMTNIRYWTGKHPTDGSGSLFWVGAGTEDTGFGFSKLTFQVSHRTDKDIDEEREYIVNCLRAAGRIADIRHFEPNVPVTGKYISDGRIVSARLV